MWFRNNFFKYSTGSILVLLIIVLLGQVRFILDPIKNALMVVALPLIVTLLFYYILRPLVRFLTKRGLPKIAAVIISFILILGLLVVSGVPLGRTIMSESSLLLNAELPKMLEFAQEKMNDLSTSGDLDFLWTEKIIERASELIEKIVPVLGGGLFSGIYSVVNLLMALLLVPFILFYFLKDATVFAKEIIDVFPQGYRNEAKGVLLDFDKTLSSYITGQGLVCLIIGVLMYVGYLVIGLPYALVLALFSMISAVIPFLGPVLGIVPAVLVGLSYDVFILIKILAIMLIVQQLEGTLITPQIMGKTTQTHPVTIIIVLLLSASLFGFVGILLAIPSYAILKVAIKNGIAVYKIIKKENADA